MKSALEHSTANQFAHVSGCKKAEICGAVTEGFLVMPPLDCLFLADAHAKSFAIQSPSDWSCMLLDGRQKKHTLRQSATPAAMRHLRRTLQTEALRTTLKLVCGQQPWPSARPSANLNQHQLRCVSACRVSTRSPDPHLVQLQPEPPARSVTSLYHMHLHEHGVRAPAST